ncbi:MAG: hypothetical protein ABR594_16630 [Pyrinomonadaceae bacterium]
MSNLITPGRFLAAAYAFLMFVIAFNVIPNRDPTKHFAARRYLGANTRLSKDLLVKPETISFEESYSLDQELKKLHGKYLKEDVATMMVVTAEKVSDWPHIDPTESFPVEVATEPDWVFLNQGSLVQVWVNNKPSPERARVLAIVPSANNKWMVLLKRQDIAALLAGAKEPHVVRLEVMAGVATPTPDSSPSPVPSPTQWPAPSLSPTP